MDAVWLIAIRPAAFDVNEWRTKRIIGNHSAVSRSGRTAAGENSTAWANRIGCTVVRSVRGQRASRIVTVALQDGVDLAVASIGSDVAAAIIKTRTKRNSGINRAAIGAHPTGDGIVSGCQLVSDKRPSIVVVVVEAVLSVDPETFELGIHHEVDHAGHGVSTVNRRSTTGQHVNALDHGTRDHVDVGSRGVRIAGDEAAAVDQHQVTFRAEAAQVQRGCAGSAVGVVRTLASKDLRERVNQIFHAGGAGVLDFFSRYHCNRAGRIEVWRGKTRTGDDDGGAIFGFIRRILCIGRQRGQRKTEHCRCRCEFEQAFHVFPVPVLFWMPGEPGVRTGDPGRVTTHFYLMLPSWRCTHSM